MTLAADDAPASPSAATHSASSLSMWATIRDPAAVMAAEMLVLEVWRREHPELVTDNGIGPFAVAAANGHQRRRKAPPTSEHIAALRKALPYNPTLAPALAEAEAAVQPTGGAMVDRPAWT